MQRPRRKTKGTASQHQRDADRNREDGERLESGQKPTTKQAECQTEEDRRTGRTETSPGPLGVTCHHRGQCHQHQQVGATLNAPKREHRGPIDGQDHQSDDGGLNKCADQEDSARRGLLNAPKHKHREQGTNQCHDGEKLGFSLAFVEPLGNETFESCVGQDIGNGGERQKKEGPSSNGGRTG